MKYCCDIHFHYCIQFPFLLESHYVKTKTDKHGYDDKQTEVYAKPGSVNFIPLPQ